MIAIVTIVYLIIIILVWLFSSTLFFRYIFDTMSLYKTNQLIVLVHPVRLKSPFRFFDLVFFLNKL